MMCGSYRADVSRVLILATTTGYQTRAFGDAASRLVRQVLGELDLKEINVQVREGGRRGMTVTVLLPAQSLTISQVQEALSRYLFDVEVSTL